MNLANQKRNRKEWIKNLKSQIIELVSTGKTDKEIRKQIKQEFAKYSTKLESIISIVFIALLVAVVLLGVHISYTILLWEANIYAYSDGIWSPYVSMLLFGLGCVLLFVTHYNLKFHQDIFQLLSYKANQSYNQLQVDLL